MIPITIAQSEKTAADDLSAVLKPCAGVPSSMVQMPLFSIFANIKVTCKKVKSPSQFLMT